MKIGIIANYNLDGAISSIFLDMYFKDDQILFKSGGYGKLYSNMKVLVEDGIDKLIVVGFPLTKKLYQELMQFKHFMVFDSNDETARLHNAYSVHYHPGGACMAVSKYIIKNSPNSKILTKQYVEMAIAASVYTTAQTNHRLFNLGYKLNVLFFKMNMWGFKSEFQYGLPTDNKFPTHIRILLRDYFTRRDKKIFTSAPILIGTTAALYYDDEFIDDYAIAIPGYNTYYTIRKDFMDDTCIAVSIRVAPLLKNLYDLNARFNSFFSTFVKYQSMIVRHSGNKSAYGITFNSDVTVNQIVAFLEEFTVHLEENSVDKSV